MFELSELYTTTSLDAVKVLIASALPIIEDMTRDVELTIYGGKAKM